eukprot:CAMPEP_0206464374 /NCGR_PEP_ID=MMETSP0324_2-20121206/27179_1 /ASSEMBLY_ACC=CAM_ASM_000836 /TAXON_ID=2866 /ORGANISM="Crypthecodinium cohnii, Strain Seligo" /LENGTH=218 /DNA_ID=CAMNT_0053936995 /DNA_START=153 /DNA_END=809 /DNA_ORIENTATION=+
MSNIQEPKAVHANEDAQAAAAVAAAAAAAAVAQQKAIREAQERAERERVARQMKEMEEVRRRAEAQKREEEEARRQQEEMARREREEQEKAAREERERRAAAEEAAKRQEAARVQADRKRRSGIAGFLKEHGFQSGVGGPKRNLLNTTYPLHRAAKLGDGQMVEWLLMEGANPTQKNSAGRTALQVAERHDDKRGSHAHVLEYLRTASATQAAAHAGA